MSDLQKNDKKEYKPEWYTQIPTKTRSTNWRLTLTSKKNIEKMKTNGFLRLLKPCSWMRIVTIEKKSQPNQIQYRYYLSLRNSMTKETLYNHFFKFGSEEEKGRFKYRREMKKEIPIAPSKVSLEEYQWHKSLKNISKEIDMKKARNYLLNIGMLPSQEEKDCRVTTPTEILTSPIADDDDDDDDDLPDSPPFYKNNTIFFENPTILSFREDQLSDVQTEILEDRFFDIKDTNSPSLDRKDISLYDLEENQEQSTKRQLTNNKSHHLVYKKVKTQLLSIKNDDCAPLPLSSSQKDDCEFSNFKNGNSPQKPGIALQSKTKEDCRNGDVLTSRKFILTENIPLFNAILEKVTPARMLKFDETRSGSNEPILKYPM